MSFSRSSACLGNGAVGGEPLGQVDELRGFGGERIGALVHVGDAPCGLARSRLPAPNLGADHRLPLAQRGEGALMRGERALRVGRGGAGAIGGLLHGIERRARQPLVGQRGERGFLCCELFGGVLRRTGDLGAPAFEQRGGGVVAVERALRLVGGAQGSAARLVGVGEPLAGGRGRLGPRGERRRRGLAAVAQFLHPQLDLRALRGERVEAILAHQPLARGRAVAARHETVPAAHHPAHRHQPLPDRERLARIVVGDRDLRETAR
ncbi:MAG TPA: hypothetical protein PLG77_15785, partial [Burkholderiaceae bacterium]|nr:hypothetical protein [Burkholderiaceae bacterium]